jgi:hypothetical protein
MVGDLPRYALKDVEKWEREHREIGNTNVTSGNINVAALPKRSTT